MKSCPYCRSTDLYNHSYAMDDGSPDILSTGCKSCAAYTLGDGVGPLASEEEMATGWHRPGDSFVTRSPFNDRPHWRPAARREAELWTLEVGART